MKKVIAILLASVLLLTACSSQSAPEGAENTAEDTTEANSIESNSTAETSSTAETTEESSSEASAESASETSDESASQASTEPSSDILVIYFSRTGEQYNVGVIDKGNTAIVAEMIAEMTGADLFEVLPIDDHYPMTYNELTEVASEEKNADARPEYQGELPDLSGYSTIFVGAPVWWGDWPMIMYTVFENNDFSGKPLVPFSTHEGSGLSGFDKKLEKACPDATVADGLGIRGADAQNDQEKVKEAVSEWLSKLGF